MVDNFIRKIGEALTGNNEEIDPADQGYGNIRPASEDPYGDPADQGYGNIRPASEDPYGDPADQGY
jgi:hypothetical protein